MIDEQGFPAELGAACLKSISNQKRLRCGIKKRVKSNSARAQTKRKRKMRGVIVQVLAFRYLAYPEKYGPGKRE